MTFDNRVRIRVPDKHRNSHCQSEAAEIPPTQMSGDVKLAQAQMEQQSDSAPAGDDAQFLAAAPEAANPDRIPPI